MQINRTDAPKRDWKIRNAEIVVTGSEIVSGLTLDTNSQYLARHLSELGIEVQYISGVDDQAEHLRDAFRLALSRADLIITTGGLGPTVDDLSMSIMAEVCSLPLIESISAKTHIKEYFNNEINRLSQNNWKQCLFPKGAELLINPVGTAYGAYFHTSINEQEKVIALLPGPPNEMKACAKLGLFPRLQKYGLRPPLTHDFRVTGIGEPRVEMLIQDIIRSETEVNIATYVDSGEVRIHISSLSREVGAEHFNELCATIRERMGDHLFEEGQRHLSEVVFDKLKRNGKRIVFAESCTAGLAADSIASIPGASEVLLGSFVVYTNEMKAKILGVDSKLLEEKGAVSAETVKMMAESARNLSGADYALAISGYAGPDGGDRLHPPGTAYIGVADHHGTDVKKIYFHGERNNVRKRMSIALLDLLREVLSKEE